MPELQFHRSADIVRIVAKVFLLHFPVKPEVFVTVAGP